LLQQKDLIDQEGVNASPEDQETSKKLQTEYTDILKSETKDMEVYTIGLQDHVFDYFNLIVKEYYMSLDKWGADNEYVTLIKEEYKKIDDEADEEEAKEEIPEFLNQPTAEQLLTEKETLLKSVYSQIVQMQNQGKVDGANYDLE